MDVEDFLKGEPNNTNEKEEMLDVKPAIEASAPDAGERCLYLSPVPFLPCLTNSLARVIASASQTLHRIPQLAIKTAMLKWPRMNTTCT
jgi:hypothetical protein